MISPLNKLSVLLVDDNANMLTIVKTILKSFGVIHIYEAREVADALNTVRKYAIDLAFIDYNLGFMDGIEFVKMIRIATDSPNPYLPIVMLTAHTEHHRVLQARDAGATEFLAKPVTAIEVYRRIVEVVERPRAFLRTSNYFGPDRRRHDGGSDYKGPERRKPAVEETSPALAEAG